MLMMNRSMYLPFVLSTEATRYRRLSSTLLRHQKALLLHQKSFFSVFCPEQLDRCTVCFFILFFEKYIVSVSQNAAEPCFTPISVFG